MHAKHNKNSDCGTPRTSTEPFNLMCCGRGAFLICFRFASVLLPFCFRYAGKSACHGNRVRRKSGAVNVAASVLLPFCFRFASVMRVKVDMTMMPWTWQVRRSPPVGCRCASPFSPQIGPGPQNRFAAPVCFRSASVLKGFLGISRFLLIGAAAGHCHAIEVTCQQTCPRTCP